jgi:hypothetical protein
MIIIASNFMTSVPKMTLYDKCARRRHLSLLSSRPLPRTKMWWQYLQTILIFNYKKGGNIEYLLEMVIQYIHRKKHYCKYQAKFTSAAREFRKANWLQTANFIAAPNCFKLFAKLEDCSQCCFQGRFCLSIVLSIIYLSTYLHILMVLAWCYLNV